MQDSRDAAGPPEGSIDTAMRGLAEGPGSGDLIGDLVAARLFGGLFEAPKIGRFAILEVIGSGGMGTVYAAHDPELDRKVAIKVVRGDPGSAPEAQARLVREARVLARLNHPHVVTIHESGVHDDQVFVVMEHVEGRTIAAWADERPRSWVEIVEMYVRVGEGLAAAHALGVVHRDFKPANVLVGIDERPRVVDFGLARPVDPRALAGLDPRVRGNTIDYSITATGQVCGTPGFIAPELFSGARPSPHTDLYAYCMVVMEALSGEHREQVPGELIDLLLRGLARDPADRWPAMEPLLEALRAVARSHQPSRSGRPLAARRGPAALALAGLTALLIGLVILDRLGIVELFRSARIIALDLAALLIVLGVIALGLALARRPGRGSSR